MGVDDWRLGRFGVGDLPVGAAVSMASTGSTRMPRAGSPRIWKLTFCVFIFAFRSAGCQKDFRGPRSERGQLPGNHFLANALVIVDGGGV
jgi:hypothetical protein